MTMGDLSTLEVIIIAIVEGLTEFLPVSSTGHMIITQNLLGYREYGVCESLYGDYTVWCNSFSGLAVLEALFPSEPYTGSGGDFRIETLSA